MHIGDVISCSIGFLLSSVVKGIKMYFDDQVSKKIKGYGVGTTAEKGRYHLLASLQETDRIKLLCLSSPAPINGRPEKPIRWCKDEIHAVQVLRSHKRACQKCLRSIETIEMES